MVSGEREREREIERDRESNSYLNHSERKRIWGDSLQRLT